MSKESTNNSLKGKFPAHTDSNDVHANSAEAPQSGSSSPDCLPVPNAQSILIPAFG